MGHWRRLTRLAVVQHQAEAVALVSRALLGAVGDVLAIGRIERRRVAGGIVGGDVFRLDGRGARRSIHRDDPEIVVGGCGFDLVVVRGVANLLPVGREGVVVLSTKREHGCVVVAGGEVQRGSIDQTGNCGWISLGRSFDCENVAALSSLVGVPMPIEQSVEDDGFDFRFFGFFRLLGVAGFFCGGRPVALGIHIRGKKNVSAIGRPEFTGGFRRDRGQFVDAGYIASAAIKRSHPNLRSAIFFRDEREALAVRRPARTVAVLIGDKNVLALDRRGARRSTIHIQRDDPDVRSLRVRCQIHVDRAEEHPLAVGRRHGLADALQLHHVFEREGVLGLGEGGEREKKDEKKS